MKPIVQWLVRASGGRIIGPITTQEVIRKIRTGTFVGEESISKYPEGRWHPISYEQSFFDVLLEVLESELGDSQKTEKPFGKEDASRRIENLKEEREIGKANRETVERTPSLSHEDVDAQTPVIIDLEQAPEKPPASKKKSKAPKSKKKKMGRAIFDEVPQNNKEKKKEKKKKSSPLDIVLILAALGLIGFRALKTMEPVRTGSNQIHLARPNFKAKQKKMTKGERTKAMARAVRSFRNDNFTDYLKAQDALISLVSRTRTLDAYGYLCMTYKELWPFSHQDSEDYKTFEVVLGRIQQLHPKSPAANICLVVFHWLKGKYDDAQRIMDDSLQKNPGMIFFNHMMGELFASRRDYRSAAYYFGKVRELWKPPPVWSKSMLQLARMYRKANAPGQAIKLYRSLLKNNPSHAVARIEMGILELTPYQNISQAQDHIKSGLASGQSIPKSIESEAYLTLAKISILLGNNRQALKHARQGFSIDTTNEECRELIISLGGIKALNDITISNVNLVYLGEQYMKMKNYTAAQAEFRGAYEANPKNGFAALRAGEALWAIGQSNEAIEWVKKSIQADPNFIRSYMILAEFQSRRFKYEDAVDTLKAAYRLNPRHHGIYRGFAHAELQRRNYPGAVRYSKKALELYDTDIPSLIILAEALTAQGEAEEAFNYLQRATELDPSNEQVHVTFARISAALQGTDAGITFLESKASQNGDVLYLKAIGDLLASEERNTEAIQYYYDALEKNPKHKETIMALAKTLQKEKRYNEARDYFLEAATLDPTNAEPIYLIGQLYLDSGKYPLALKNFKRVIGINPNYPLANFYAGQAQLNLNNTTEALKMAEQERLINPEIPESYTLAGDAYYKNKQYVQCAEEYQKALAKGLRTSGLYVKLARCERLRGNFDSTLTMLTEAEQVESGNPDIYKELGALYHLRAYYIKAKEAYTRYLQLSPNAKDRKEIERRISSIQREWEARSE